MQPETQQRLVKKSCLHVSVSPPRPPEAAGKKPSHPPASTPAAEQLWERVLGQLQLQMTRPTFEGWVEDTQLVAQGGDTLGVGAPSEFAKDWLEQRLSPTVH